MPVPDSDRRVVELPSGAIEYREEGDPTGPPVVFGHGLLMNDHQWDLVLPLMPDTHRYLLPVLPLGGHRRPMPTGTDLGFGPMVHLFADFIAALDLRDATVVVSDWGGPLMLPAMGRADRVSAYVVFPSEAFDNFPPGIVTKLVPLMRYVPGAMMVAARQLRVPRLRRLRLLLGGMADRPIDQEIVEAWTYGAIASRGVRADARRYAISRFDDAQMIADTERLAEFDGPAMVVWPAQNRMMPPEHGPRLAGLFPRGEFVQITDASVLTMLDAPERTAELIAGFLAEHAPA